MKAVLISIQPKWCELIASGKKTVEVRKTKPKLETPSFKCYIYQIKMKWLFSLLRKAGLETLADRLLIGLGKVIGEFVCDCITPLYNVCYDEWERLLGGLHKIEKELVGQACLTEKELHSYANGKRCYAWHISNLVIYDKPKDLSEFTRFCDGVGGNIGCRGCKYYYSENNESTGLYEECTCNNSVPLKRPPQSWCYVEERSRQ